MKKIAKLIVATALMLAPLAAAPAAMATTYTCPSGYILETGPDSKNICVSETKYVCTADTENNVAIVNENGQIAISGEVELEDNTNGGSAGSGNATNDNSVTFNVEVDNEGQCKVVATTQPTPEKPEKPEQGAGAVTTPEEEVPTVLPNTSSDLVSTILTAAAVTLGLGAAGLFLGVTAYRLFQTK